MSGEAYSILKHNKGVDERDKDASEEAYSILKYCCPVKVLHGKKIRLKPSCRISASFVTLLVAKKQ